MISMLMITLGLAAAPAAQDQKASQGATREQATTMMRDRMMKNDKDGDGRISKVEFEAAMAVRGGRAARFGGQMFDRIDADRDGAIAGAELDRVVETQVKRLDSNGDGAVSRDEAQAARSVRAGGGQ